MTRPMLRSVPPRPDCCTTGAPVGSCPTHDTWRRLLFLAPPPRTPHDDDQEDDQ